MEAALVRRLLKDRSRPVRVGLVGLGAMGRGILYQTILTPGVECVAICDSNPEVMRDCARSFRIEHEAVSSIRQASTTIRNGKTALTTDGLLVAQCPDVDILVEATSAIEDGARFVVTAIENGKHVVLMNAEIDLFFGPYFLELAQQNNVRVTSCDGDQHGVLKRVIDDMSLWGFEPVMAGNIKSYLDRYADPEMIKPEADKRRLDYKMCTAYTDGSKLSIEMAILANALDMETLEPGMTGPRVADVTEVLGAFDFSAILDRMRNGGKPVVDYILGAQPGGGVYAVGYHEDEFQSFMMDYYKMGPGPFYLFYRPYHLCHVESLASIVGPVVLGESLLEPTYGFKTNTFSYGKRDLKAGETLDGIGGHACYGLIENVSENSHNGLPLGLAEHVELIRKVEKDQAIQLDDIVVPDRFDFDLFERAIAASARLQAIGAQPEPSSTEEQRQLLRASFVVE